MPDFRSKLPGFHDELEKIAGIADFVAKNQGMLGSAGALLGHGAAAGAVLGGLHSGYKSYREAKDQGAGGGQAAVHGVLGSLGGIGQGALSGALIGAGSGAALSTLRPQAAEALRKTLSSTDSRLGALGRFGQRQMHGLTGWKPSEGLSSDAIRGGSWGTQRAAERAAGTSRFEGAMKELDLHRELEKKDLTHLPGVLKGLAGPERVENAKRLFRHGTVDPLTKLQLGLTGVGLAGSLLDKTPDPSNGEHIGANVGQLAGGLAGSALPFGAGALLSGVGAGVGRRVGKAVDWLRSGPSASHTDASEAATNEGMHQPFERGASLSAEGTR